MFDGPYVYSYLFLTNLELIRCHPAPGPKVSLSSSVALQRIEIEYSGHRYVPYYVYFGLVLAYLFVSLWWACRFVSSGRQKQFGRGRIGL